MVFAFPGDVCGLCGCTDARACPGGCYWAAPGLCSACIEPQDPPPVLVKPPTRLEQLRGVLVRAIAPRAPAGHLTLGPRPIDDPIGAIKFAIEIDDHFDRLFFLQAWLEGDLGAWPDFVAGDAPSAEAA